MYIKYINTTNKPKKRRQKKQTTTTRRKRRNKRIKKTQTNDETPTKGDDIYDTQWDICTIDIQERVKLFESIYINLEILFGEDTKRKQTWMYLSHDRLDNNTLWDLLESGDKENLSRAVTFMHGVVSW